MFFRFFFFVKLPPDIPWRGAADATGAQAALFWRALANAAEHCRALPYQAGRWPDMRLDVWPGFWPDGESDFG